MLLLFYCKVIYHHFEKSILCKSLIIKVCAGPTDHTMNATWKSSLCTPVLGSTGQHGFYILMWSIKCGCMKRCISNVGGSRTGLHFMLPSHNFIIKRYENEGSFVLALVSRKYDYHNIQWQKKIHVTFLYTKSNTWSIPPPSHV